MLIVTLKCKRNVRYSLCDTLRSASGNPDDSAPAARSVKVEVVHVEHRTPARRVTGVGMTLTRAWARRRRQDLTFALAAAVLLLLDLLRRKRNSLRNGITLTRPRWC